MHLPFPVVQFSLDRIPLQGDKRKENSMKKHIVCFGDSNTHGYCPCPEDCADHGNRFNEEERWTSLLQKGLGDEYLVHEEGLNSRTTVFEDPLGEGLSGISAIRQVMLTHAEVDLLIIMLGTNDCKERFSASPYVIAQGLGRVIEKAKAIPEAWHLGFPNILVIAPPAIREEMKKHPVYGAMGPEAIEKSRGLAKQYAFMCLNERVTFLDAGGTAEMNSFDGMHLTRKGHAQLAEKLLPVVKNMV